MSDLAPEALARLFHETYEQLAPDYGYRTRKESAKPWDEVPAQNRALMVATAAKVLATWMDAQVQHALLEGMKHTTQCNWKVANVRGGVVTWRCWCGRQQSRVVRVYGMLPAALLWPRNWPYGIIGCPRCATIYNAGKCKDRWHEENR